MTKEEVFEQCLNSKNGVVLQEKNFKKNFPETYEDLNSFVKDADLPFIQKLYNYFHGFEHVPQTPCGKNKKFRNFRHGYNDFCSVNCKCMTEHGNRKREETSLERYGVTSPTKSKDVKDKISKTKLGYTEERKKEILEKRFETVKEKYGDKWGELISNGVMKKHGVKNVSQIPEVVEKTRQTHMIKYGGIGFASKELMEKSRLTNKERNGSETYNNKEKREKKCLEKYNETCYFMTDEFKEKYKDISFSKYGVDNPSKNDEIKKKISEKVKNARKKMTLSNHKDIVDVKENTFVVKCDEGCVCGGFFEIPKHIYFQRKEFGVDLCTARNPIRKTSEMENGLLSYIQNIYDGEVTLHSRKILSGKEIDIYLPEIGIGFEFNGDYWHANPIFSDIKGFSENVGKHKEKWISDMEKYAYADSIGICIYPIWEFEWKTYNEETKLYVKNIIDNKTKTQNTHNILKSFLMSLETEFNETEFGLFVSDNAIVRYANGFYCGKNSIDNEWFVDDSKKRVIYVYDFEISDNRKFGIIKSLIRHAVGETKDRIYARNCELKEITNKDARDFLNENSLFGHRNANITFGLYYKDELVMVYSFGYNFYGKSKHVEVIRVCTKKDTLVVGGSSKCLNYFKTKYKDIFEKQGLVFYVDKIHQDGRSLKDFKFVRHEYGVMNYWNMDYNDGEISGKRGTAFNRMPSKHKKIKELERKHIITCIKTAGVDVYEYVL